MTVIVGVLCSDGVVIGADSALTLFAGQYTTIEQVGDKIDIVEGRVIVTSTGSVGLAQRFVNVVRQQSTNPGSTLNKNSNPIEVGKQLAKAGIEDFTVTHAPKGQCGALVAFECGGRPHLIEFGLADFQPELTWIFTPTA